jgi:hypothetical protein
MAADSAEEIVRECYPHAALRHHKAVYEMGRSEPVQPESWVVYASLGLGGQQLGEGHTALAAWVAASNRVLQGLPRPTGLQVKRQHLSDAGRVGAGAVPLEAIEDALNRGEEVTVEEPDGSFSLLKRAAGGRYITKPK